MSVRKYLVPFRSVVGVVTEFRSGKGDVGEGYSSDKTLIVLHSIPAMKGEASYVDQLIVGAAETIKVETFSWNFALRGEYDVFHIHWPEFLIRGKTRLQTLKKLFGFFLMMVRLNVRRTLIVRTVHNVVPHEARGTFDRLVLRYIDYRTDVWIRLNEVTELGTARPVYTVPHGHYRHLCVDDAPIADCEHTILYFGHIRPYKNVERLVHAFRALDTGEVRLKILGKPLDPSVELSVRESIGDDQRIEYVFGFVADSELVSAIQSSLFVVLPYREMHNSGAVLMALSINCPCVVPDNEVNRRLAQEVGAEWLHIYEGEVTDSVLAEAIRKFSGGRPQSLPNLDARDWDAIGRAHRDIYVNGLECRRG